jgi:copper chaperone CopZ
MRASILKIMGMNSEGCADKVAARLIGLAGVNDVRVSLLHGRAVVEIDERSTSEDKLISALADVGYPARTERSEEGSCCGGCCH